MNPRALGMAAGIAVVLLFAPEPCPPSLAARGGPVALALGLAGIALLWRRARRGGSRGQILRMAARGVAVPAIARRTGLAQDAIRAVLDPFTEPDDRDRKSLPGGRLVRPRGRFSRAGESA